MADQMGEAMQAIEEFYFGDGEECGEQMFKQFAEKHVDVFKGAGGGDDEEVTEHKLE